MASLNLYIRLETTMISNVKVFKISYNLRAEKIIAKTT